MSSRRRLLSALAPHRWVLEPALAVVLFGAWFVTGLPFDMAAALALVFYCAAVALSRTLPGVSLGLVWVAVLLELTEQSSLPGAFRVIAAIAVVVALVGVASHGGRVLRWLDFASAILLAPATAYLFTVRGDLKFPQFGPVIGGYYTSQGVGFLLMSLLLAVIFVAAWLLGFLVARQRAAQGGSGGGVIGGQGPSVLVWLASSGGAEAAEDDADRAQLVRRLTRTQLTVDIVGAVLFEVFCLVVGEQDRAAFVVITVFAVAVALRRMSPAVALSLAWLAAVLQMTTGHSILVSDLGVLIVLYATAAYGDRVVRAAGLISAGIGAFVAALYLTVTAAVAQGYYDLLSSQIASVALQFAFLFVVSVTVLGLSWVLGLLVRTWRNARAARRARDEAELVRDRAVEDVVVEQERTRIARDMHDVVAHSLAVVIAQADGARYARQSDPDAVDEALATIASTARSALGDVRVLLAELRASGPTGAGLPDGPAHVAHDGPQPSLADLDQTVEHIRSAGLDVRLERTGAVDRLGSAQQLAAYRIVQEALTNALRHGDTSRPASVVLVEEPATGGPGPGGRPPGLVITVRNTMRSPIESTSTGPVGTGAVPRIGHGMPGMRERASLAGGSLSAGPVDGEFVVSAFLPGAPVGAAA
ncbi:two-component sensor histidine kinase [Leifsonia xyli]|uniref:sensor histidine kinase n=1 Tax=Leifsonia xyli TaxID=1575 RepID=UPI0007CDA4FE|nr:two-component sensor histidine kinase [Leifsonia xyli]